MSARPAVPVATLDDVLAELRAIRQLLEQRPEPATACLSRDDRQRLARLLPVLGATYGDEGFTSRDCREDEAPALRLVLGKMSVKAIAKLLGRAEGTAIDGLMVRRLRMEFQVIVWQVVAC